MLCLHIAWNFQEVFLNILSLFPNLNLMSVLFIHEMFLVYKLETFTNCKEVKHIMVVIIAIIYIFLSYDIFDQLLEILSPLPKKKIHLPPFCTHSPTKNSKGAGGEVVEDTMLSLV